MGHTARTTKLLLDLSEREQGGANRDKRRYLEEMVAIYAHPDPRPAWNFSQGFPDFPNWYRRSVIKDCIGKIIATRFVSDHGLDQHRYRHLKAHRQEAVSWLRAARGNAYARSNQREEAHPGGSIANKPTSCKAKSTNARKKKRMHRAW